MGINRIDNTAIEEIRGVAGDAISAGDLVINSEAGKLYSGSETIGIGSENNTDAGAVVLKATAAIESSQYAGYDSTPTHNNMCILGNGNVAILYPGNQSNDGATNLNLRIRSLLGGDIVAKIVLSTASTIYAARAYRLTDSLFLCMWSENASLKFSIRNNDGTESVAATSVDTMANSTVVYWNCCPLASGGFAVMYDEGTSRDCILRIYNSAGELQGSEIIVESAAQPRYIAMIGCSDGDVAFVYQRQASTVAYKLGRYTSAGVIVGSLVSISSSDSTLPYGPIDRSIAELSNGNVAFVHTGGSSAYPDISVYSSSHTLVKTIDLGSTYFNNSIIPCLVAMDSGFAVLNYLVTNTYLTTFDNSGNGLLGTTGIAPASSYSEAATGVSVIGEYLGAVGFVVLRLSYGSGAPSYEIKMACVSPLGVAVGSTITIVSNTTTAHVNLSSALTNGIIALSYKPNSASIRDAYYYVMKKSVLGVALDDAAKGATVRVATDGVYTINQNYGSGGNFDNTATAVPGSKGTVIGTSAILMGVN